VGEAPASGAVGFGGGNADGGVQREAVQVPGWRARAGRVERGRERVAVHLGRPAAGAVNGSMWQCCEDCCRQSTATVADLKRKPC
jgi:hypothetical protein